MQNAPFPFRSAARLAAACGLAAGLAAAPAAAQLTEPFPAVFDLASLTPAGGGDGSLGFVAVGRAFEGSGASVSFAGDIDGDGIDDLVVGARFHPYTPYCYPYGCPSHAYILFGRDGPAGQGFPAEVRLSDLGGRDGFQFATGSHLAPVASAGDINGDGIGDVIIGSDLNRSFLLFGRAGGGFPAVIRASELPGPFGFVLLGEPPHDGSGRSVASAGDINRDGVADLIIGAPYSRPRGRELAGASHVVFGRAGGGFPGFMELAGLDGTNGFRLDGDAGDLAGLSVAGAGDINADGVDDLIVSAPLASGGVGAAFVVFGRAGGGFPASMDLGELDGADGFRLNGMHPSLREVAAAGDVNGDGIDDLVIGSSDRSPATVFVVFGRDVAGAPFPAVVELSQLDGSDGFRLVGPASGPASVAGGDLNGDGLSDVIVGLSDGSPPGRLSAGQTFVVYGRDARAGPGFPAEIDLQRLDGSDGFRLDGALALDASGASVASAGDMNGDGADDLIIGAPHSSYGGGSSAPGEAYIIYGRTAGAPCPADCDADGKLTFFDFLCFQNLFDAGDPGTDCDESGSLDLFDFLCFQNAFAAGCP